MYNILLIGCGAVTRNIHLPAYDLMKDRVNVVAACDSDPEARAKVAGRIPTLYATAEEMLTAESADVVVICTPPQFHRDHCILALGHGFHVFCEKPIAMDLDEVDDIITASDEAGRVVVVNTQFPYMDMYQAAKDAIGTADFGELQFMHAWQHFKRTTETEAGWRGEMNRRLCLEFGIHVLELARYFFQADPISIHAHMPGRDKSDVINTIALEFPDGRGAAIVLDRLSHGPHKYLELSLDGEHASIHTSIGGELRIEAGIRTSNRRPFVGWHFVKGGKALLHNESGSRLLAREGFNPFASATATHFGQMLDAIDSEETPPADIRDNRSTLALVLAAYESAESGQTIKGDSIYPWMQSEPR
jgi:D-apiose dehydrogenase